MGKNNKAITQEKINQIKALLATGAGVRAVAESAGVSPFTAYRVKVGCYDSGKLDYKYEKVTEKGMFNPKERENWLI